MRLARVLDEFHTTSASHLLEPAHIGKMAVEMHRNDGGRPLPDGLFDCERIDRGVVLSNVDDHRPCTRLGNGLECRNEGERRHDHLVSGLHSSCEKPETQASRPLETATAYRLPQ